MSGPGVFLKAEWRDLIMLNFEADPQVLLPRVPRGTELDMWNGKALVSIVGFRFLNTKLFGVPVPFHRNFEEINLRFYVGREVDGERRRAVVFVKEIVPRYFVAKLARRIYGERYVAHPMNSVVSLPADSPDGVGRVDYAWEAFGWRNEIWASFQGEPKLPDPASEEAFVTEHYWGYVSHRHGATLEYRVEHPQWRVWRATDTQFECDISGNYGVEFIEALSAAPTSAFIAEGSPVTVHRARKVT